LAIDHNNPFIRDAQIDGRVQTVFFNEENTSTNQTRGAWTGAVWLNARSGYLADMISVGGSAYRVARLNMKPGNINPATASGSNSAFLLNDSNEGFGKLGQAYIDLKLPKNSTDIRASAKIGRQMIQTGLVRSSVIRSVPSSWQGVNASLGVGEFDGSVAWLNRVNQRTGAGFHRVLSVDGEVIDSVMATQFSYTVDLGDQRSLQLQYNGGLAKDYVIGHNGVINFDMPLSHDSTLSLSGQYYRAEEHGELWNPATAAFADNVQVGNVNVALSTGPWSFNAGVSYTKAAASPLNQSGGFQTIGSYDEDFGANALGLYNASTAAIYADFDFDNEIAFVLGGQYSFSESWLHGLSVGYSFFYGTNMTVTRGSEQLNVHEMESDLTITYEFQQPKLKGLEFQLSFAYYTNSEALFLASGQGEAKDLRSYLIYHFSL